MRTPFFGSVIAPFSWMASLLGAFAFVACGGTAETKDDSSNSAVTPGHSCPTLGASEAAADGCNTCTCTGSGWACTERACGDDATCVEGETTPSDDGCNTCTCQNGALLCTLKACAEPEPTCTEGETVPSPDGCNTCVCGSDGTLACTKKACVDPGESKGCGGWLGNTCADDEYCAYEEGQLCGAADASATCQKRPEGCTQEYLPVCGCDGETYGNECEAASAGTGVNYSGECNGGA